MAEIRVTAQELRTKAGELRDKNGGFKNQVATLESQEGELIGMWEGQARDMFDQQFKKDVTQFNSFYTLINEYAQALETIAQKYEQAEAVNVSTASTRNY